LKFINNSKNTVNLIDLDIDVPFLEDLSSQYISLDDVKKSNGFRRMVILGLFEITEHNNTLFERDLIKRQKKMLNFKKENKQEIQNNTETPKNKIEVKLRGSFLELGGYAKVNRNLTKGLSDLGVNVAVEPTSTRNNQLTEEELNDLMKYNKQVSKNAIVIESVIPTFGSGSFGRYRILYTTIESETIPQQFIDIVKTYNEVWVVSDFCKEILLKYGINDRPIYVIPNTVDNYLYIEDGDKYKFKPELKDFIFISVFGWSYRKGYDVLLKSYLKEFSGDDNVSLLIVSRNHLGFHKNDVIRDEISKFIEKCGGNNPAHIARCSKFIPEKIMPSIYRACDAFVLFTRGESYGIPYVESSLCGLPVIGTNCTGQTMFLKKDNSFLLDVDDIQPLEQGLMQVHYWDNQMFPVLRSEETIKSAGKLMRYVYENYDEAKEKNLQLSRYISENYNIERVAKLAKKRLSEIWRKL